MYCLSPRKAAICFLSVRVSIAFRLGSSGLAPRALAWSTFMQAAKKVPYCFCIGSLGASAACFSSVYSR